MITKILIANPLNSYVGMPKSQTSKALNSLIRQDLSLNLENSNLLPLNYKKNNYDMYLFNFLRDENLSSIEFNLFILKDSEKDYFLPDLNIITVKSENSLDLEKTIKTYKEIYDDEGWSSMIQNSNGQLNIKLLNNNPLEFLSDYSENSINYSIKKNYF